MEMEYIWTEDPDLIWKLSEIHHVDFQAGFVVIKTGNETKQIDLQQTNSFDATHTQDLDNLCFMNKFHEAPLLHTLRSRFGQDRIYTSIGDVLVSINPYKWIDGLYENSISFLKLKKSSNGNSKLPHIYHTANDAFSSMHGEVLLAQDDKPLVMFNQSIVVSGESGAGKTEASKKIIQFLIDIDNFLCSSNMSGRELVSMGHDDFSEYLNPVHKPAAIEDVSVQLNKSHISTAASERIKHVLNQSHFIFESFGNARTVRNDNSSRFGKFVKLQYDSIGRLESAVAETFLLERSRLQVIGAGERSYHVFYQMVRGSNAYCDKTDLGLETGVNAFRLLLPTNAETSVSDAGDEEKRDATELNSLCEALVAVGCTSEEMQSLWQLLSVILHLGNFHADISDSDLSILSCSTQSIANISRVIGVEEQVFLDSLTIHLIQAKKRSSIHRKFLSPLDTMKNVFALIKYLYSHIFSWLLRKINASFRQYDGVATLDAASDSSFIGILDIFGFEIFEENSFEQLCINYANEQLQHLFNSSVFAKEQEEYSNEGIVWQEVSYRDNMPIIDLISKKPNGLLVLLDEQGE
jgi:myosin-5